MVQTDQDCVLYRSRLCTQQIKTVYSTDQECTLQTTTVYSTDHDCVLYRSRLRTLQIKTVYSTDQDCVLYRSRVCTQQITTVYSTDHDCVQITTVYSKDRDCVLYRSHTVTGHNLRLIIRATAKRHGINGSDKRLAAYASLHSLIKCAYETERGFLIKATN